MGNLAMLMHLQRNLRALPQASVLVQSLSEATCHLRPAQANSPVSFPLLRSLWTSTTGPRERTIFPIGAPLLVSGFASTASGNAAPPAPSSPPSPPPVSTTAAPAAAVDAAAQSIGQNSGPGAGAPPPSPPQSGLWRTFKLALGLTSAAAIGAAGYATYAYDLDGVEKQVKELRQWKEEETGSKEVLAKAAVTLGEQYLEARRNIEQQIQSFSRPSSEKLLPDLRPNQQHVYTLVLDLNDTLVHSDWKRERGWRTFKRPGATEFLEQLAQYYEIVIFSDQLNLYVDPILDRLDPKGCVSYRLYRDATHYTHGKHVRDLSKLNRDMSRVIFVSGHGDDACAQPENLLAIKPWKMDQSDTALLDHLPFLEFFARQRPSDARAVLKSYEGQDIPSAFRERTKEYKRRLMERKRPRLLPGWGSSQP